MKKERLDVALVELGHFETREKAKRAIMAGIIFVDNQRVDKAGTKIDMTLAIEIKGKVNPYVSRGGLKLEKAIKEYGLKLDGCVCADIGASTGGFTDCMLQNGAAKVFSIDVGYGQLDWKLRNDERVVNMERTNVRGVTVESIQGENLDFASIDVSFISLKLVLPVVKELLKDEFRLVYLIKPQFEAGREQVKKNGVVRDKHVHINVLKTIVGFSEELGIHVHELTFSPIKGPKGNIEFLAYCSDTPSETDFVEKATEIVEDAYNTLNC